MSLLGLVLKGDFFTDWLGGLMIGRPRLGLRRVHSMSSRSSIRLLNVSTLPRLPRARLPMICTIGFARKVWHAPVCLSSLKPMLANDLNAYGVTKARCRQQALSTVFVGNLMDG
jgi:hypothetical protein